MIAKYLATALLGTSLLAGSAMAQTSTNTTTNKIDNAAMMNHQGQWRASKLVGVNVYNNANEKLGDIQELIIDKSGNVQNVIIGVGGFLGMGEHNVAVSFDKLTWVNEPMNATTATNAPSTTTTTTPATRADGTVQNTTGMSNSAATTTRPVRSANEQWYPDHAMLNATKDQLKSMTEFKY